MIKFLIKFLLIFSIGLQANESLTSITDEIFTINHQILIIDEQSKDKNASLGHDLDSLKSKKAALLEQIPLFITSYDSANLNKIKRERLNLQKKAELLSDNQVSDKFIRAKLNAENANLDEIFYSAISNLANAFLKDAKQDDINSILENTITNVQVSGYQDIKALKDSLSDELKAEFNDNFINLEIKRHSYQEILDYLKSHSDLLAGNFLFSSLKLKDVINYINKLVPFDQDTFNFGKFFLILVIFVFFISIRRMLSKIVFSIFTAFLSKEKKIAHKELQEQFILVIKKPISVFLIAYSVDICLSIFYYPSPVPINFANYFTIIYIVLISWLVLGILDGYGMVILSKIAQKSGRKEVVNLIIKILYFIVVIITILLILSRLGFDISALIASLGIGGLAVALATKDIIANFFASIMLLFDNSFSQGDWIVCAGVEGTVVEIGLRKTTVRTFDNALVFVPNSKIMSENVKNWNRRKVGRQIKMTVGLSYSCSKKSIEACINDIRTMLLNHPGIAKSGVDSALNSKDFRMKYRQNMISVDDLAGYKSNLFVVLDEFADSSINILIYCFSKTVVWGEFLATKQDVMLKIMDIVEKYDDASFAFPSNSIYIEQMPKIEFENLNLKGDKNA